MFKLNQFSLIAVTETPPTSSTTSTYVLPGICLSHHLFSGKVWGFWQIIYMVVFTCLILITGVFEYNTMAIPSIYFESS